MDPAIRVGALSKVFQVPEREAGLQAAFRSLIRRRYREVRAVDKISFEVAPGEMVGFLGPNGAGKTTTLKMLSGLLYPTSGDVQVLGHVPSHREKDYLRQITLVMGNRNQLAWDIPALDSYDLNRSIYNVPAAEFKRVLDELIALLELETLVQKPVRNLSLGERMKAELVGALLHAPRMLFLDEPTIGLDVTMQRRLREFIALYNRRYDATVLLTSHYMADVQALCKRVIVIHRGCLLYDGALAGLLHRFSPFKTIVVTLAQGGADLSQYGQVLALEGDKARLRVPKADTARVTARLLTDLAVDDLTIEDAPIETVIEDVFAAQVPEGQTL